jgi:hypothetical protein
LHKPYRRQTERQLQYQVMHQLQQLQRRQTERQLQYQVMHQLQQP